MLIKTIAKCEPLRYNRFRVGAWCSGSTWASDSHGVGSIPIAPANAHTPVFTGVLLFAPRSVLARKSGGKSKAPRRGVCIESSKRRGRKLRQAAFHDIPLHRRKTPAEAGVFVCGIIARFFSLRCAAHAPRDRALRRGRSRVCRRMRTRVPARKF